MEPNEIIREQIIETVENQLKANDPPETKQTYDRLIGLGYDNIDAKQLIGQCVAVEIFDIMKFGTPYNEERYIENLKLLPEEPGE